MQPSFEYFLCIAKHNNITRAAEELHITQQSLSSYLKRLEDYYELPLFTRKPSMALTDFGKIIYDRARMIQNIHDEIESTQIYYQDRNPLRIGFSVIHVYQALDLVDFRSFKSMHLDTMLYLRHGSLKMLTDNLCSGDLDLYFSSYFRSPKLPTADLKNMENLLSKEVRTFSFKIIVHPKLLLDYFGWKSDALIRRWKAEGVSVEALSALPMIILQQLRNPIFQDAKRKGYFLRLVSDCDNLHLIMELVSLGLGFSIIPNLSKQPHTEFLEFPVNVSEKLQHGSISCYTTVTALTRPIVQALWDSLDIQ